MNAKLFLISFSDGIEDFLQVNPSSLPLQPRESLWSLQSPDFQQLNTTVWAQFLQALHHFHCHKQAELCLSTVFFPTVIPDLWKRVMAE